MKGKTSLFFIEMVAMLTMALAACSSNDYESSTDPRLRILGTWKKVVSYGWHVSEESIFYTFSSDGKVCREEKQEMDGVVEKGMTFEFDDEWTYDEKTDEITGIIYITYPHKDNDSTYRAKFECILGKNEMRLYGASVYNEWNIHVFERQ
ncbi:MAG: hypothetical protein IJK42_15935 [Prevotella sp.]|nr:hypothetical protein [Prevotella sp.]MBQ6211235.1 hypothetical protein [Prevotella sp.]